MKHYPAYKDSGIEWIGKIPVHWQKRRVKSVMDYIVNGIWGEDPVGDKNDIVCVRVADFDMSKLGISKENLTQRNINMSQQNNRMLSQNDILIEKSGGGEKQTVGRVISIDIDEKAVCSNFVGKIAIKSDEIIPRFGTYLFFSMYAIGLNQKAIKQTTGIQNLDTDNYFNEYFYTPSFEEQKDISEYLDHKTAQIDDLIAKKERMIELLKEERTAVINQIVTKGLDPKAEMKDSGIEWIGKVPKRWSLKKIKYVARVNSMALPETTEDNYEFSYVDIGNVDLEEGFNIGEKINFVNAPSRARRIVRKGDTIVSTVRTYLKAIAYFENDVKDIIVSTGFAVVAPQQRIIPKFLYYVLRSEKFIDRVCALSVGVSYPAINSTELSDIVVWYPEDTKEQLKIVEYLDRVVAKTKLIIFRVHSEISLLKEYRTALISEVVTGKIDVRN